MFHDGIRKEVVFMKKSKVKQMSDVPHRAFIKTTKGGYHHVYGRDQGAH